MRKLWITRLVDTYVASEAGLGGQGGRWVSLRRYLIYTNLLSSPVFEHKRDHRASGMGEGNTLDMSKKACFKCQSIAMIERICLRKLRKKVPDITGMKELIGLLDLLENGLYRCTCGKGRIAGERIGALVDRLGGTP